MKEWSDALCAYTTWLTAGQASSGTIKLRLSYLRRFSQTAANPWNVTTKDLLAWIAAGTWKSAETRKCARASLRSFYHWAMDSEETPMTRNPAATLPVVKVPPAKAKPAPEHIIAAAMRNADPRERLMILLGNKSGLRRAEISSVRGNDLGDNDLLYVVGKGGRARLVPIIDEEVRAALIAVGTGYLFPGNDNGHISPWWTGVLLSRLLGPGWTGHKLRHAAGTRGFRGTHNIRAVQEFLGHASVRTTQIYTAVEEEDLRAVAVAAA